jgi:hypothetical protein
MKSILFLLSKIDGITRNHIICAIEGERWNEVAKRSTAKSMRFIDELLPLDKVRVSYDRTFRRLRELGLIEGGFPSELPPLSPYAGTLWRGYSYTLTDKGRKEIEDIVERVLDPLMRYCDMLMNARAKIMADATE